MHNIIIFNSRSAALTLFIYQPKHFSRTHLPTSNVFKKPVCRCL